MLFNKILFNLFCAFFIIAICGCQENARSKPVATADGMKISISEFNERFTGELSAANDVASMTPADYDSLKEEVLATLIDEKLMLMRARELSLTVSDSELTAKIEEINESYSDERFEKILAAQNVDYGLWKEKLRERMILEKLIAADVNSKVTATESEARAYYRAHRRMYSPKRRVHVAQIVVRVQEKAEAIRKRLNGGEDFGKVAEGESIGPEAAKGGDLGFISQGVMPEEIDAVIFSQQSGEISPVIKTQYGYHILKIIERDEWPAKKWAAVKEQILTDLRKQKEEQAYVFWLNSLRSKSVIKIDLDLLKKGTAPLNQKTE